MVPGQQELICPTMVETRWPELAGETIEYADRQWELTGGIAIQNTGELLEAEAKQVNDVRAGRATLHFGLESRPASLNPGNLKDHFQELAREGDRYVVVVHQGSRTYRYELRGITPD